MDHPRRRRGRVSEPAGSPAGRDLAAFADTAFVHAMHITTLISAVITLLGVLVVVIWMPGRSGRTAQDTVAAPAATHAEPVPAMAPAQVAAAEPDGAVTPAGLVASAGEAGAAGSYPGEAGAAGSYAAAPARAEG